MGVKEEGIGFIPRILALKGEVVWRRVPLEKDDRLTIVSGDAFPAGGASGDGMDV